LRRTTRPGESRTNLLPGSFFERQPVLAFGVAFFATRHKIAFGGLATPNDRHEMIHGQGRRREFAAAMMADAGGSFALPPLAGTQLPSFSPLAADFFFTDRDQERNRFHRDDKRLSVPSFNIYEINSKSDCSQKIAGRLKQCPAVGGL
jgi:hypothetical protein